VPVYFVLALALTWPLAKSLTDHLPQGTEQVASVPALNAWTVWWNAARLRYGLSGYWHAPIFYPARYALAFSEAQPTTFLVAPIAIAFGPAAAYNIYLLLVLTLNGAVSLRLLRRVGVALVPATIGGAFVETLPIVHWQLGVLQLTTICGVVWLIDRLVALREAPTTVNAFLLGLAAFLAYAACNYFVLFLSVLLPLSFLPLVFGRWFDWRFWAFAAFSVVVAGVLASPILWAQFQAKAEYEWKRDESLLVSLSAKPHDYLNPPRTPFIPGPKVADPQRDLWFLGDGPFRMLLACTGIVAGLAMRGRRRWTLFLVLFGAGGFLLSLGPPFEVRGWSPYKTLMSIHPGLALARSPFRFAFFVQLAIALLGASAIDGMWTATLAIFRRMSSAGATVSGGVLQRRRRLLAKTTVVVGDLLVLAMGGYATAEVWPARQKLFAMPELDRPWIQWLKRNSDPASPVVCLPYPAGSTVGDYERTAIFMLEQIGHRRPMVGGYSGFFPQEFLTFKEEMPRFPAEEVMNEMRKLGVKYIVIADPNLYASADRSPSLGLAFRDGDAKVRIYKVLPPPIDYERFFTP